MNEVNADGVWYVQSSKAIYQMFDKSASAALPELKQLLEQQQAGSYSINTHAAGKLQRDGVLLQICSSTETYQALHRNWVLRDKHAPQVATTALTLSRAVRAALSKILRSRCRRPCCRAADVILDRINALPSVNIAAGWSMLQQ